MAHAALIPIPCGGKPTRFHPMTSSPDAPRGKRDVAGDEHRSALVQVAQDGPVVNLRHVTLS